MPENLKFYEIIKINEHLTDSVYMFPLSTRQSLGDALHHHLLCSIVCEPTLYASNTAAIELCV